jgi:hypothetical protein
VLIFLYYIFSLLFSYLVATFHVACDEFEHSFSIKEGRNRCSFLLGEKRMLMCLMVFNCQNGKFIISHYMISGVHNIQVSIVKSA